MNSSYDRPLPPRVLQLAGLVGLFGCVVFWAFTYQVEPVFVAAFGGLIGVGQQLEARRDRKADLPPERVLEARERD